MRRILQPLRCCVRRGDVAPICRGAFMCKRRSARLKMEENVAVTLPTIMPGDNPLDIARKVVRLLLSWRRLWFGR